MTKECGRCGKSVGIKTRQGWVEEDDGRIFCYPCYESIRIEIEENIKDIVITTTMNVDGFKIKRYIDIESVEIVIGTGIFSEISSGISDMVGARSTAFEKKLHNAKKTAFTILKKRAYSKGGNAIIGIDIDYTEFSGNRIGLILNGTIVDIEPISNLN